MATTNGTTTTRKRPVKATPEPQADGQTVEFEFAGLTKNGKLRYNAPDDAKFVGTLYFPKGTEEAETITVTVS